MRFVGKSELLRRFKDKSVAIVGSGPSSLANEPGLVDSHDEVVRVNNFRLIDDRTGRRATVHYSFFGGSIRKDPNELIAAGVTLCMNKCPDSKIMESDWHRAHNKENGVDFRTIYERRKSWWFGDVYAPSKADFMKTFRMLDEHIPTTGFSAILDVLAYKPSIVFLTGFDFFASGLHNINEPWKARNNGDPIGHVPERELAWLAQNFKSYPLTCDDALRSAMTTVRVAA